MKTIKKIGLILSACTLIAALLLTGCGGETTTAKETETAETGETAAEAEPEAEAPQEAKLTDGYFKTQISGLNCFYRFNEDNTYYGYFFDGGVTDAGTYELQEKSMDYYETYDENEAADESTKKTAPQVLVLTSYAGGDPLEIPYDGDRLCDFTAGGMSSHVFMDHDAAFDYVADDMEPAIVVQTLYNNNDSGMTLTLYHNRTFVDYTGDSRVSGTWDPAEGGYTLTTEDGETLTLTVGGEITYEKGGEVLTLTDKIMAGQIVAAFESEEPAAVTGVPGVEGASDCEVKLMVYDNDTMELITNIFGNEVIVDRGTYTLDTSTPIPAYTFTFETAGEVAAEPDYASATESSIVLVLNYTASEAPCSVDVGGTVMDLALSFEVSLRYTYEIG